MNELAPRPSQPCQPIPYGLVSLWDMFEFHAAKFVEVLNTLSVVEKALSFDPCHLAKCEFNTAGTLAAQLKWLQLQTKALGLPVTLAAVDLAVYAVGNVARYDAEKCGRQIRQQIEDIRSRLTDELRGKTVYFVPSKPHLAVGMANFGDRVAAMFPSAEYDISEAAKCLTLARSTACVMHLMRVLEIGLTALATNLGLAPKSDNWHSIIRSIQEEIAARNKGTHGDKWKDVDEPFFSEAVAHFRVLKNAWRNHSMHARAKYTEEEADEIYQGARSFMRHLSERLYEPEALA